MDESDVLENKTDIQFEFLENFNFTNSSATAMGKTSTVSLNSWLLIMYSIIFLLATVGNSLVILTLVKNKRMRTPTNLFLLNLAVSDLFLGVFCMPFTLVGTTLRNFIFGRLMCKLLPYLQASSVSVSAWTLVAISVERYYGICHPLSSRQWQTTRHAYKLILLIWLSSLMCMSPIAVLSKLIPTRDGHQKCREVWPDPSQQYERAFNIFLDMVLLVLPLVMLTATYSLITNTLWQAMTNNESCQENEVATEASNLEAFTLRSANGSGMCHNIRRGEGSHTFSGQPHQTVLQRKRNYPALRRSNAEKNLVNKKRVIKMLLLVVLEFFICWAPLFSINTIALFDPKTIYFNLGYEAISVFQLLAYSSSCCNPVTYCFMNSAFRQAFLKLFHCCKTEKILVQTTSKTTTLTISERIEK